MKGFFNLFVRSAKELKSIRCLTVTAMLIALDIILKLTVSIPITESLKMSFAFIALSAVGMLYGPTVGALAGFICDILGFIIKPTGAFDIRYTFIEVLGAVLYGLFLYNAVNDKWMLPRIIAAKSVVVIVCNLFLTTLVSSSVYGNGFFALLPGRTLKNIAQLPLDVFLLALFLPLVLKAYNIAFKGARHIDEKLLFCDGNVTKSLIIMYVILFAIVCFIGVGGQHLVEQNKASKNTNKEQQARIEVMQSEIDKLYAELGIEKPVAEANE